jgi:putative transposase
MDLKDASTNMQYLIRDRDSKYTAAFDSVLEDEDIEVVTTGVRVPRMNAIMERWVRSCRAELLDRTLIVNQAHLMHALREYETFYNQHRTHRALHAATPLHPLPQPTTDRTELDRIEVQRRDRLGGILHPYQRTA